MNNKMKMTLSDIAHTIPAEPAWADGLEGVKARSTMECGVLGAFEPLGITDVARYSVESYDIYLCQAVIRHLGVDVKAKPTSIEARLPELQQGRMDLLVVNLGYSPLRGEQAPPPSSYYDSDHKLTVKLSRASSSPAALSGKRVSFTKGDITKGLVKISVLGSSLTGYEDTPTAFAAPVQDRLGGFSASEVVAHRLINKQGDNAPQFLLFEPPTGKGRLQPRGRCRPQLIVRQPTAASNPCPGSGDEGPGDVLPPPTSGIDPKEVGEMLLAMKALASEG
ncbi:transporter substrate-binding domain-containing protein [Pseudomonas sp. LPB0260]|uniref:transporter substrate-binding domain-containing protein n=1 Tax=Pseudomonas sp. LPB0260 TaxID=2614442 RepID=UPI0015C215C7|nr:transporter substrate-binding domain-containing protein [Pseudomonas sp. LPB0260]QLC74694.1 transporter substrate-binding domain-containing protein [Pseudomonas sp. LPB0260]